MAVYLVKDGQSHELTITQTPAGEWEGLLLADHVLPDYKSSSAVHRSFDKRALLRWFEQFMGGVVVDSDTWDSYEHCVAMIARDRVLAVVRHWCEPMDYQRVLRDVEAEDW